MLYVSVFLGVVLLVSLGCNAAEPQANVDSQARKIATFKGGSVTQGELDQFAQLLKLRVPDYHKENMPGAAGGRGSTENSTFGSRGCHRPA